MIKYDWTLMIFTMADQPGLRAAANRTLQQISMHSDSPRVKVVAQVTLHGNNADPLRRYDFDDRNSPLRKVDRQNKNLQYQPVKFVNARRNLAGFLEWAQRRFPARHYCVVLQGHAWGADYTIPSLRVAHESRPKATHEKVRLILGSPRSRNHLSNKELKDTLARACRGRKFAILGMDSCLMSMAEICYQLRNSASYTVAPEGLGPVKGWPFDKILARLGKDPSMDASQFALAILGCYSDTYRTWGPAMKLVASICSLKYSSEFVKAMKKLVASLRDGLRNLETCRSIINARVHCEHFHVPTYIDLFHFCQLLMRESAIRPGTPLFEACKSVQQAIKGRFVEAVFLKRRQVDAYGLSIFFPDWELGRKRRPTKFILPPLHDPFEVPSKFRDAMEKINAAYADHEFADQTGWRIFLLEFIIARLVP